MGRTITMWLLALALLGACSADDAEDAAGPSLEHRAAEGEAAPVEEAEVDRPEAAGDDADASGPGEARDGAVVRGASQVAGRRVIRTAEIELASEDPDATVDEVLRLAERAGGFVATTDLRRDDEQLLRGTVTLRVPSGDLLEVLGDLEDLTDRVPVSRIDERDVSDETSDLEARVRNLSAYEQQLTALLADVREDTSSPDDLLRIFERVREVRAEIDTLEGRLASLSDQVELATVTVRIEPARTALAVTDPTWQPLETVREALTAAARGLGRVADLAIWLVVGMLPVVLVVAAPVLVAVLAGRRLWRPARADTADETA